MDWDRITKIALGALAAGGLSFGGVQTSEQVSAVAFVEHLTTQLERCQAQADSGPVRALYREEGEACDLELLPVCDRDYKARVACKVGQCEAGCLIPAEFGCP